MFNSQSGINVMKKLAVAISISLAVAACTTAPKTSSPQTSQPEVIPSKPQTQASPQVEVKSDADNFAAQLKDLEKKSVYFDFDKFNVKPAYQDVLQQQAEFIKAHKNETVVLEGNADERGSNEYNLALGNRRAEAVRKSLVLLGIPEGQIKTVSLGEEKARLSCHEEKCWKENRRVDFVHKLNP